jgi:hypothetical protein
MILSVARFHHQNCRSIAKKAANKVKNYTVLAAGCGQE